jgi:hypothetical protein
MTTNYDDTITHFVGPAATLPGTPSAIYTWGSDNTKLVLRQNTLTLSSGILIVNEDKSPVIINPSIQRARAGDDTITIPHSVIQPGDTANIEVGATFRIAKDADFRLLADTATSSYATFNVKGTVEVLGTLTVMNNVKGDLDGTINVKKGGTSTGKYVFEAGATAKINATPVTKIGAEGDSNAIIQLTEGTFTNTVTDYILDGKAKVAKGLGVQGAIVITVKAGSELTVDGSSTDVGITLADTTKLVGKVASTGKTESKIVIVTSSWIGVASNNTNSGAKNFYTSTEGTTANTFTDKYAILAGTYTWNATVGGNGTPGWKATP